MKKNGKNCSRSEHTDRGGGRNLGREKTNERSIWSEMEIDITSPLNQ